MEVSNTEEFQSMWKVSHCSRLCYHKMEYPSMAQAIYATQLLAIIIR